MIPMILWPRRLPRGPRKRGWRPTARSVPGMVFGVLGLLALAGAPFGEASGQEAPETTEAIRTEELCQTHITLTEQRESIPSHLLGAISLVESGRWNEEQQRKTAWPWTVTANGKGNFHATKADAVAAVKALRAANLRYIDVGCMQVNLGYHPKAFATVEEALDPARNVAYAARFLRELRQRKRSWATAVGYYHSASWGFNAHYRLKVMHYWNLAWRAERLNDMAQRRRARNERTRN